MDHTTPALLSVLAFSSIWGEEFGWRWFLQDYLKVLSPMKKYILIGVLWELWHLRFLAKAGQPVLSIILSTIVTTARVIILAIIIGVVTDRTRSLFFASALHGWVDLCAESPGLTTYISAGLMVALCVYFYVTWEKPPKEQPALSDLQKDDYPPYGESHAGERWHLLEKVSPFAVVLPTSFSSFLHPAVVCFGTVKSSINDVQEWYNAEIVPLRGRLSHSTLLTIN